MTAHSDTETLEIGTVLIDRATRERTVTIFFQQKDGRYGVEIFEDWVRFGVDDFSPDWDIWEIEEEPCDCLRCSDAWIDASLYWLETMKHRRNKTREVG